MNVAPMAETQQRIRAVYIQLYRDHCEGKVVSAEMIRRDMLLMLEASGHVRVSKRGEVSITHAGIAEWARMNMGLLLNRSATDEGLKRVLLETYEPPALSASAMGLLRWMGTRKTVQLDRIDGDALRELVAWGFAHRFGETAGLSQDGVGLLKIIEYRQKQEHNHMAKRDDQIQVFAFVDPAMLEFLKTDLGISKNGPAMTRLLEMYANGELVRADTESQVIERVVEKHIEKIVEVPVGGDGCAECASRRLIDMFRADWPEIVELRDEMEDTSRRIREQTQSLLASRNNGTH